MILVDASVWVDHLRAGDKQLAAALDAAEVLVHPFVLGEIACSHLRHRREVLELLDHLPSAPVATTTEVLAFIEDRKLMGRGLGYVDVHLLAATALSSELRLWTRDKRLGAVARQLGLGD